MIDILDKPDSVNGHAPSSDTLALLGGEPAFTGDSGAMLGWPFVTEEDEAAVLGVLRRGAMSGLDVTQQFETEFAAWQGSRYGLGFNNGTAAIQAAMFACGVGVGDEIICPSITYWASALQCFSLGATVVFADVDAETLCIDPGDIERHISPRTKAIVVVHYSAYPAEMDEILHIARRHNLKVIEDVSHAQGGYYKGRKLGSIGDVGAMSLMTAKSFAIGEAGMLVTDDTEILERATAFGHYERFTANFETESLRPFAGLPMGGYKHRMHQLSAAMGRVQLKYYDARCAEIEKAMMYFWELLEGTPGLRIYRTNQVGSTMSGWYHPMARYHAEELGGLSVSRFAQAVTAEGVECVAGCNFPLHLHPMLNDCDIYGHGKPTRIANSDRDLRQPLGSLPVAESVNSRYCTIPYLKHYRPAEIEKFAAAFRKVANGYKALLESDSDAAEGLGSISLSRKQSG